MKDAETGQFEWIDTSSKKTRENYKKWWFNMQKSQEDIMKKAGVDYVSLATDEDYVKPLMNLFKRR